jgi:AsmA protein
LVLDGSATIGRLVVSRARVEEATLKVTARDGIISLDPIDLKLYQGKAVGKSVVNVKGERPVTEVQLAVDKVQANPLLKDLVGKDFIEGAATARLSLSMTGEDPARIKRTLNGTGSLDFADGAIVGVDLANMVRNVKTAFAGQAPSGPKPRTDFSELTVPFTIHSGVFTTQAAMLRSPLLRLEAAGSADLVREALDFRVEPKIVGTIKGPSGSVGAHPRVRQLFQPRIPSGPGGRGQRPAEEHPARTRRGRHTAPGKSRRFAQEYFAGKKMRCP